MPGVVVLVAGLAGCLGGGGGGGSSSGPATGEMSLAVTDAPIGNAVVVQFSHVELQPQRGPRQRIDFDEVKEIDLLALQGEDNAWLFQDVELPAGRYQWIRLHVVPDRNAGGPPLSNFTTSSHIEFEDGSVYNLVIPSGLQTGLKLVRGFTVPAGGPASFTVDVDLRKVIRIPSDDSELSGYYRMKPAMRLVDNTRVGRIIGTIAPGMVSNDLDCTPHDGKSYLCPGAAVYIFAGENAPLQDIRDDEGDPVTTADVRSDHVPESEDWQYRYRAGFLPEGGYTVALTFQADQDDPEEIDDIAFVDAGNAEVEAGMRTVVDFSADQ